MSLLLTLLFLSFWRHVQRGDEFFKRTNHRRVPVPFFQRRATDWASDRRAPLSRGRYWLGRMWRQGPSRRPLVRANRLNRVLVFLFLCQRKEEKSRIECEPAKFWSNRNLSHQNATAVLSQHRPDISRLWQNSFWKWWVRRFSLTLMANEATAISRIQCLAISRRRVFNLGCLFAGVAAVILNPDASFAFK